MHELLRRAATHAADFRASLPERPIPARGEPGFGGPLPAAPTPPDKVLEELIEAAEPALMATPGPRFFGLVVGGALPAATAADMLAVGWDQLAFNDLVGPAPVAVEEAAGAWLKELLGIPATASCGFVTGAQGANTVGLAAARHHVLRAAGWDVERDGLIGAPRVRVVASAERHVTVDRSLRLLGFGARIVEEVRADANGAVDTEDLARVLDSREPAPTIVVLQTGNVNTGACDDLRTAIPIVHRHGGWAHVDGAFGLWAAAAPQRRHLTDGVELADSWGCDGHKWLNVPYDSAFAFVSRPQVHAAALSMTAAYLTGAGGRQVADRTVESSRRARGFAVWAALRELGRDGVAELVERCCRLARRFADGLADAGFEVANDVVLNQVLVSFGEGERTDEVIAAVQRDGTCWMGGTTWRGRRFMRIAVSNYATTEADVDRSVAAVVRCASR
ncbi:aspartate aminotransferase family protein [Virgisporangium aliadipatigenens]|uniref:Aspartate aminotransferase family protein n=1 Tax=Virgisporangium aliadipatigenens TaxID=741659 RepID=A0A8J3YQB7_9ACTN|nr:pyridoxal-dependent decarboxylase [Virgisporangium aliadipatigenens]GIJ47946.1 aspartate aminotransferase family protein [Virgisporangium aliadipatigenens]